NAWSNQITFIQFISVTGHLGISFWVVFTAALGVQAMRFKTRALALSTIASLLILPSLSLIYFASTTPAMASAEFIKVTVIQPNHDSYLDYGGLSGNNEVLDSLFSITKKVKTPDTDLIVWPENAIDRAENVDSFILRRISDSAKVWNINFIVGTGLSTV